MKPKMILLIVVVAAIAAIAVMYQSDFAFSDSQCVKGGCSGEICGSTLFGQKDMASFCIWMPEYGCNKDCKLRNFRCDFDQEFGNACRKCVSDCRAQTGNNITQFEDCYKACY